MNLGRAVQIKEHHTIKPTLYCADANKHGKRRKVGLHILSSLMTEAIDPNLPQTICTIRTVFVE